MLWVAVTAPLAAPEAPRCIPPGETQPWLLPTAGACPDMTLMKLARAWATAEALGALPLALTPPGVPCTASRISGAVRSTAADLASRRFMGIVPSSPAHHDNRPICRVSTRTGHSP